MSLVINDDKCARCGVCVPECPTGAIVETEDSYVIDPELCNECQSYGEPQCVAVCPNEGIQKNKESLLKKCINLFG